MSYTFSFLSSFLPSFLFLPFLISVSCASVRTPILPVSLPACHPVFLPLILPSLLSSLLSSCLPARPPACLPACLLFFTLSFLVILYALVSFYLASGDDEGFDLIQPSLIQQLRKILDEYPDDGQILKVNQVNCSSFLVVNPHWLTRHCLKRYPTI